MLMTVTTKSLRFLAVGNALGGHWSCRSRQHCWDCGSGGGLSRPSGNVTSTSHCWCRHQFRWSWLRCRWRISEWQMTNIHLQLCRSRCGPGGMCLADGHGSTSSMTIGNDINSGSWGYSGRWCGNMGRRFRCYRQSGKCGKCRRRCTSNRIVQFL
jgi:hypothetical protein